MDRSEIAELHLIYGDQLTRLRAKNERLKKVLRRIVGDFETQQNSWMTNKETFAAATVRLYDWLSGSSIPQAKAALDD